MWYIVIFIIGLLFGSFWSVILHRLGEEITWKKLRSVLVGRSHCPHCKHTLAWYDLFPLFSRLVANGKCRYCGTKVSHRYPLLEIGSGLLFLGITYRRSLFGMSDIVLLIVFLFINWCLYLLMIHDIRTMYLHNAARWLLVAAALVVLFYGSDTFSLIAAAQRVFIFWVWFLAFYRLAKGYVRIRRKQHAEGIGQGDVMVAPFIGLILRKVYTMMVSAEMAWRLQIVQYFRYYVIIACIAALLLLFITPVTTEGEKRMIPFFPGMIAGVRIMMAAWPWLVSLV